MSSRCLTPATDRYVTYRKESISREPPPQGGGSFFRVDVRTVCWYSRSLHRTSLSPFSTRPFLPDHRRNLFTSLFAVGNSLFVILLVNRNPYPTRHIPTTRHTGECRYPARDGWNHPNGIPPDSIDNRMTCIVSLWRAQPRLWGKQSPLKRAGERLVMNHVFRFGSVYTAHSSYRRLAPPSRSAHPAQAPCAASRATEPTNHRTTEQPIPT